MRPELEYLGHIITKEGIKPNKNKVNAIREIPLLKNQKQIKQFLGLTGYYRRFIQNYSNIAKPLNILNVPDVLSCCNFDSICVKGI